MAKNIEDTKYSIQKIFNRILEDASWFLHIGKYDTNNNLNTNLATSIAGEDIANDVLKTEHRFSASNITLAAPTTTLVKTGVGLLHSVIINKPLANGVIAIYDGVDATGTLLGTITKPATLLNDQVDVVVYDIPLSVGLCIVTSGAAQDITVTYR